MHYKNSSRISPPAKDKSGRSRRTMVMLSAVLALTMVMTIGTVVQGSMEKGIGQSAAAVALPMQHKSRKLVTPPRRWKLAFRSNFSGKKLDTRVWATCYWWAQPHKGCTIYGPNHEKEWYLPSQVRLKNGILHLVAQRRAVKGTAANGKPKKYLCRSGMVTTFPGFRFKFGFVRMVARIPYGKGLWPAFWLAAANKQWPPEMDVFEHWNYDPAARVYLHPKHGPRQGGTVRTVGNLSKGWHTYTLYWTKKRLSVFIGKYRVFTTTVNIPRQAMYLIANVADTRTAPGACSGTMLIKSIKVWRP